MGRKGRRSRSASPASSAGHSDDSIISAVAEEELTEKTLESRSTLITPEGIYRGDGMSRGVPRGSGDRTVQRPHQYRQDTGTFGIYVGNWGGKRSNDDLQAAVEADLLASPGQVIMAQECQAGLLSVLETGQPKALSAVAECDEEDGPDVSVVTDVKPGTWRYVYGDESAENSLLIAGKTSTFANVELLLWEKIATVSMGTLARVEPCTDAPTAES